MTVFTHPSDSGSIDTANFTACNNCSEKLAVRGNRIWKGDVRQSDRIGPTSKKRGVRATIDVCPSCDTPQTCHKAIQCEHCNTKVAVRHLLNPTRRGTTKCPCCEGEITEHSERID